MSKIVAFVPCRQGSQRVHNKNIKTFSDIEDGLIYIKLSQLIDVKKIEKIIVSTNDIEIKRIARSFNNKKIVIDDRSEELSSSTTSTDDLVSYVPNIIASDIVLWTHVTSPFITSSLYEEIIKDYFEALKNGFDSLMTVSTIHGFLWDKNKPINYDRNTEKWPRTQTIEELYEINSGVFLNTISNYRKYSDRIGQNPFLKILDKVSSFDIDWQDDFLIAECILRSGVGKI